MPIINASAMYPTIEGLSVLEDTAPQLLRLSDLNVGILSISSQSTVTFEANNVNVTDYLSIEAGFNSSISFSNGYFWTQMWIGLQPNSSFTLIKGFLDSVSVNPRGRSTVVLHDNVIQKPSSLTLNPGSRLVLNSNTFEQGMHLTSHNSSMLISHNTFRAPEKPLNFGQSWLPNFLLEVRCSIWFWIDENVFYNGTFQISDNSKVVGTMDRGDFDYFASRENFERTFGTNGASPQPRYAHPTSPKYAPCSLNLEFGSSLKFNRFVSEERKFRVYDLLDKPAEPRLVFLKGLDVGPLRSTEDMGFILDATQNWWGDPSGPFVCCNLAGQGSYTSLFVNVSDWCGDPLCGNSSKVMLPSHCLRNGCSQRLTRTSVIIFALSALVNILLLVVSIAFTIYHNIRHFSVQNLEKYSREHLLPKAHVQWRVGLGCSTIGAFLAIVCSSILLQSTMNTPAHAHQHIIPFRGFVILWIYNCLAIFQLILTATGIILSYAGSNRISYIVKPLYVSTLLNTIVTIVITIDWLPTAGFVQLLAHFFITQSSHLLNLLYVCSVLLCLVSISAFVPVRLMNQLLNHADITRIGAVLEVALLKELMQSPAVEVKAKYLRISSAVSIILGCFPIMTVIYDLTIDSYFRTRLWLSALQHSLGFLCLIAIFVTSFYYHQRLLTTLLSLILATVTVGIVQDIIFWSYYLSVAVDSIYSNNYVIFQIAAHSIWVLSLVIQHILVYLLNRSVSIELPKMAIENLNQLIDRNVYEQFNFTPERIPLLFTESDSSRNSSIQHESEIVTPEFDYFST